MKTRILAVLAMVFVLGCAQYGQPASTTTNTMATEEPTTSPPTTTEAVEGGPVKVTALITGHKFQTSDLTIKKGTTLTWKNLDSMNHPLKDKGGAFKSGDIFKDSEYSYVFDKAGTYTVEITAHPGTAMVVTVE